MATLASDIAIIDRNSYDVGEDKIEYIQARELLVSNRIDLIVKYKFVEAYDRGINVPFLQQLYYTHLEAFTDGKFIEPGKEGSKRSFQDYLTVFEELINSIKRDGVRKEISVIPVGRNNAILNGSHRVAIAMYYNLTVPIVRYEGVEVKYNYAYFNQKLLEKSYLDYMITEYIRLKENVFFVCIWPRADKTKLEAVDTLIHKTCNVVYTSSIMLRYNGLKNLMIQIYGKQSWCGDIHNGYKGVQGKVDDCYLEHSETIIYVLDNINIEDIVSLKQKIRNIYQIENSSIHISDNSKESLELAHLLLNHNSVDVLNYGKLCKYKAYITSLQQIGKELDAYKIDREDFLIDSSGVLGVYGIRNPGDIDCLTFIDLKKHRFTVKVAIHDENIIYYSQAKEDLIYNPNNYLFAFDIKFCNLSTLFEMKKRRNEKKDCEDCLLIEPYIKRQITYKTKVCQYKVRIKRKYRNICKMIRYKEIRLLKKLYLYDKARKLYHIFKRMK